MSTNQLAEHLAFFEALGADGGRREPEWRTRAVADVAPQPSAVRGEASFASEPSASVPPIVDAVPPSIGAPVPAAPAVIPVFASPAEALAAIRVDLGEDCSRCKLHTLGRQQIVFGVGNPSAQLMFVGEAPGADEDVKGEPFVGRAGQLLTKIIEAIGLTRADVYIANVIKCRPPGNRNPDPDEVAQCEPFLFRQIDTIKPAVVVALGKFAAQSLLRTTEPITRIRGREYTYRNAILMPTYHPAYLLRNPSSKREVWEDMKRVREILSNRADAS